MVKKVHGSLSRLCLDSNKTCLTGSANKTFCHFPNNFHLDHEKQNLMFPCELKLGSFYCLPALTEAVDKRALQLLLLLLLVITLISLCAKQKQIAKQCGRQYDLKTFFPCYSIDCTFIEEEISLFWTFHFRIQYSWEQTRIFFHGWLDGWLEVPTEQV